MNLKLAFFKFFNFVYADTYVPHGALENNHSTTNGVECSGNGVYIENGELKICPPKANLEMDNDTLATQDLGNIFSTLSFWIDVVRVVSVLLCLVSLAWGAIQLAISADNSREKQKAWGRIRISLIGLAVFGGLTTIIGWALSMGNV